MKSFRRKQRDLGLVDQLPGPFWHQSSAVGFAHFSHMFWASVSVMGILMGLGTLLLTWKDNRIAGGLMVILAIVSLLWSATHRFYCGWQQKRLLRLNDQFALARKPESRGKEALIIRYYDENLWSWESERRIGLYLDPETRDTFTKDEQAAIARHLRRIKRLTRIWREDVRRQLQSAQ